MVGGEQGSEGGVVACKSACEAFGLDQYCCSGEFANPTTCQPSIYSTIFKRACPRAYSYAYDDGTSTFTCKAYNYAIIFCPNTSGYVFFSLNLFSLTHPASPRRFLFMSQESDFDLVQGEEIWQCLASPVNSKPNPWESRGDDFSLQHASPIQNCNPPLPRLLASPEPIRLVGRAAGCFGSGDREHYVPARKTDSECCILKLNQMEREESRGGKKKGALTRTKEVGCRTTLQQQYTVHRLTSHIWLLYHKNSLK